MAWYRTALAVCPAEAQGEGGRRQRDRVKRPWRNLHEVGRAARSAHTLPFASLEQGSQQNHKMRRRQPDLHALRRARELQLARDVRPWQVAATTALAKAGRVRPKGQERQERPSRCSDHPSNLNDLRHLRSPQVQGDIVEGGGRHRRGCLLATVGNLSRHATMLST